MATNPLAHSRSYNPASHISATSNRSHDQKRLRAGRDRFGQWRIRRIVRQILLTGEESNERTALERDLIANRTAQHGISRLQRVEHSPLCHLASDLDLHFTRNLRERP
jgi:hypothetical protein